jgi:hypothetical protein
MPLLQVFADAETDQSVIVELLEQVASVPDEQAATYHFNILAEENSAPNAAIRVLEPVQRRPDGR